MDGSGIKPQVIEEIRELAQNYNVRKCLIVLF